MDLDATFHVKVKCIDCEFENNLDGAIPVTANCSCAAVNPYTLQREFKHSNFESNVNGECPDFKPKKMRRKVNDWLLRNI